MTHSIVWFDLPTKDLERAARFYSKVLGCELKVIEFPGGKIVVLPHEKDDVAGCLIEAAEGGPSRNGVLVYFNCDGRLEEAVQAVRDAGGEVMEDRHEIGPHGWRAVILDTEGNRVALHSN